MAATVQQQSVFFWVENETGNGLVEARAGTGKTWTLMEVNRLIRKLGMRLTKMPTVALGAYNNKIANELTRKSFENGFDNVTAKTSHSFGNAILKECCQGIRLSKRDEKWSLLIEQAKIPLLFQPFVKKAMSLAKQRAIGYVCPVNDPQAWLYLVDHYDLEQLIISENPNGGSTSLRDREEEDNSEELVREGLRYACKALVASIRMVLDNNEENVKWIDFDDMIYMPLMVYRANEGRIYFTRYDWVMIDEAQDTNPARRELFKLLMKPQARLLAVGDPYQAIYGFTGADNDSLDIIRREFNAKSMPLTMTFRCAKAVVEVAKQIVPDYEAFEGNAEGEYLEVDEAQFLSQGEDGFTFIPGEDAILCRNTKPLVDIAMKLIRRGIACHVEGKDIGKDLTKLATRWKSIKSCRKLAERLAEYRDTETDKLLAKKREMQAESLADRVDTVLSIIGSLDLHATVDHLKAKIDQMFADTPDGEKAKTVTLMTAHRSKGLEFPRVFIYGRKKFMPSKYARQDWQLQQERNLEYVAASRAMNVLVDVKVAA